MKKMKHDRRKDMTKKAWQELQKQRRVFIDQNLGTRDMKTAKHPTRQERKKIPED